MNDEGRDLAPEQSAASILHSEQQPPSTSVQQKYFEAMKLISWNVAKRKDFGSQVAALAGRAPDVVALQEVSYLRSDSLSAALADVGLRYSEYSREAGGAPLLKHGVLVASRWPLARRKPPPVPLPESVLVVMVDSPSGLVELMSLHAPNGSDYGGRKEETLEAVFDHLATPSEVPRILCGDLNTPFEERPDGTVITFGQKVRKSGKVALIGDGGRKDRAERQVLLGLAGYDLPDVFRALHGYEVEASNWRRFRLDRVFASGSLCPKSCIYLDEFRQDGLSDHTAVEVVFAPLKKDGD